MSKFDERRMERRREEKRRESKSEKPFSMLKKKMDRERSLMR